MVSGLLQSLELYDKKKSCMCDNWSNLIVKEGIRNKCMHVYVLQINELRDCNNFQPSIAHNYDESKHSMIVLLVILLIFSC